MQLRTGIIISAPTPRDLREPATSGRNASRNILQQNHAETAATAAETPPKTYAGRNILDLLHPAETPAAQPHSTVIKPAVRATESPRG